MTDSFKAWTSAQTQFEAEEELISIVPRLSLPRLHLLRGDFGPFEPSETVEVPIWFAMMLRQRQSCSIVCPQWLKVATIQEFVRNEKSIQGFQPLPSFHFMEIAAILLEIAESDVVGAGNDPSILRATLEELWGCRGNKLRDGMIMVAKAETLVSVETLNLTAMEVNKVRDFLCESVGQLQELNRAVDDTVESQTLSDGRSWNGNKARRTGQ